MSLGLTYLYRQALIGVLLGAALVTLVGGFLINPLWGCLGFLTSAVFISLIVFLSKSNRVQPVVLLLIFTVTTVVWILLLNSHQVSDFGVYFRCGGEYTSPWTSLGDWSVKCESGWLPGFATYWRRSLLYSLPIGWLVGGSYFGFKVVNALLHIATVALLYRGVTIEFGRAAGLFSAALLAIYPEFWFVTSIVSSDNLAVIALVGFIFALAKLSENQSSYREILITVLLIVVLDLLRSIGPLLVVATLLIMPLSERGARLRLLKAVIFSAIAVFAVGYAPAFLGMTTTQTNGFLAMVVGSGLTQGRSFEEAYAWHQYVLPLVDPAHRAHLLAGLIAQDLSNAFSSLSFWFQKIAVFFGGEGYFFFATSQPLGSPDDFVLANTGPALPFDANWAAIMRGKVAFCCTAAVVGAIKVYYHPFGRASVAVGSTFLLFIILFGEVQPRYSLLIAPALCIAAAGVLVKRTSTASEFFREGAKSILVLLAGLLASIFLFRACATAYVAKAPTFTWFSEPIASSRCESAEGLQIEISHITVPLQNKGCYALSAKAKNVGGNVTFYVVRQPVPPKWSRELHQVINLTFVMYHTNGVVTTLRQQLSSNEIAARVILPATGKLVSLDVLVNADGEINGKVSLAYFHDKKKVISNVAEK
jgi:Dolichyl-phosphate-mannose-protein mannosyltransferase